jgi:hypothetical protein
MDVFIALGQSNMAGRGSISELPFMFPKNSQKLFRFNPFKEDWESAREPMQFPDDPVYAVKADRKKGGVGPTLSFADAMAEKFFKEVGIILCARGGTGIESWLKAEGCFSLYRSLLHRVLCSRYKGGEIKGIIAYLGESDTKNSELASLWSDRFLSLIANLRHDLGSHDLPVVFAQLARIDEKRKHRKEHGYRGWDSLKEHQASLSGPNIKMVKTEDLKLIDGLHLCTRSQLVLGQRFADAMYSIIEGV